jgi:hypothetical protein
MARGTQSGRIHLHQRNTDDVSQLINADMTIMAEHVAAINATTQKEMDDKTRKEYRNRIRHIYRWWMEHYPNYFENGTRVLTQEEKEDQVMFHHTNDRDIIYTGLNVSLVLAFLSHKKNKSVRPDGTIIMSSNSDIKKYNDAIKWGAKRAGQALPSSFYAQMESFILSYKKEHQQAQKEGRTDEQEADPITSTLFRMICFWAVEEGNVFVWVFSLAMWHLMSRSISIDSLAFHNIKSGTSDSIKFKFDETKADKTGEFTQEKNCYANPLSAHLCYFLSLGCWISSNAKRLASTEKLFLSPGTKNGSASQRYCTQLSEMVMRHQDVAKNHLRLSHFNAHGLRKGSGSHASSATTLPPSFVAVAARGEWSIGKILDVYFKFALGGDQYLGRILALLDPNTESFSILPPHWTNPAHPSIFRGINICFGDVVTAHSGTSYDPSGVLSLLLASMVHHSDWLIGVCSKYPSHPFHSLPLLHDNDLLIELKSLVTLEPNSHVPMATGVPPHVSHTQAIKEVRQVVTETKNIVVTFRDDLKKAVSDAGDEKVAAEGGVNMALLERVMDGLKKELFNKLDSITIKPSDDINHSTDIPLISTTVNTPSPTQFVYNGAFWFLPESFQFPDGATRYSGWKKWLVGAIHIEGVQRWRIKPYHKLLGKDIPSKVQQKIFKNEWKPIFSKMMEAPGMIVPTNVDNITEDIIHDTYDIATRFLQTQYEYIFVKPEGVTEAYTLGTWSFKIKPSEVMKHGTDADKARLEGEVQKHKAKRTITPGLRRRPTKIAKKGTGRKSAVAYHVQEGDSADDVLNIVAC